MQPCPKVPPVYADLLGAQPCAWPVSGRQGGRLTHQPRGLAWGRWGEGGRLLRGSRLGDASSKAPEPRQDGLKLSGKFF